MKKKTDNDIWFLCGNIVDSKIFRRNAKVLIYPQQWGNGFIRTPMIGLSKQGRLILGIERTDRIYNFRKSLVKSPRILSIMENNYHYVVWRNKKRIEKMLEFLCEGCYHD